MPILGITHPARRTQEFVRRAHEQGIWICPDGKELAVSQMTDGQLAQIKAQLDRRLALAGVTDKEECIDREPLWPYVVLEIRERSRRMGQHTG